MSDFAWETFARVADNIWQVVVVILLTWIAWNTKPNSKSVGS